MDPLPSDVVVRLRSDPIAALAAALILASSFPDLVSWAVRAFGGNESCRAANGELKAAAPRASAVSNVASTRHFSAARHDQALLALMRANPGASVTEIIRINRRPRNSTMASLERLERAGLVEHEGRGKWIAVEALARNQPASAGSAPGGGNQPPGASDAKSIARRQDREAEPPKPAGWIEPLSGARVARHAADGRVRGEMTMA
jgi:hypothetical protein